MPLNNTPPAAASNVSLGTLQRANMDVPGKQARSAAEKSVSKQPGAAKSSMQIDGADWGDSSNKNQYQGSSDDGQKDEEKGDKLVRTEKVDGFIPRSKEHFLASASTVPDINFLFQSLKTSGRKLIHFFVPAIQSRSEL